MAKWLERLSYGAESHHKVIGVGRGGARGARPPPNNLRGGGGGGGNIPFGPPNNPPTCTGKTIPLNSILEFSIISYFKDEKCNYLALIY